MNKTDQADDGSGHKTNCGGWFRDNGETGFDAAKCSCDAYAPVPMPASVYTPSEELAKHSHQLGTHAGAIGTVVVGRSATFAAAQAAMNDYLAGEGT